MSESDRTACPQYEARLETYLDGGTSAAQDPELRGHLERCAHCRGAFEAALLSRDLLRGGMERAGGPSLGFATRVMATIRAEESRSASFWRPLEILASRMAVSAALLLVILAAYVLEFSAVRRAAPSATQTQISEDLPELTGEQSTQDEILLTVAESGHGR